MIDGAEAIVHVDPCDSGCGPDIIGELTRIVRRHPEILTYHSFRRSLDGAGGHIHFHATVREGLSVESAHALAHRIDEEMRAKYPEYRVDIHIEPCGRECGTCDSGECPARLDRN